MPRPQVSSQVDIFLPKDAQDIIPYITERLRQRDGDQFSRSLLRWLRDGDSEGDGAGSALNERITDLENRMSAQITDLENRITELIELRQHLDAAPPQHLDAPSEPSVPSGKPPTYPAYQESPGTSRVIPQEILIQADDLNRKGMTYSGIVKTLRLPWSSTTLRSAVQRRRERLGLT